MSQNRLMPSGAEPIMSPNELMGLLQKLSDVNYDPYQYIITMLQFHVNPTQSIPTIAKGLSALYLVIWAINLLSSGMLIAVPIYRGARCRSKHMWLFRRHFLEGCESDPLVFQKKKGCVSWCCECKRILGRSNALHPTQYRAFTGCIATPEQYISFDRGRIFYADSKFFCIRFEEPLSYPVSFKRTLTMYPIIGM